MNVTNLEIEFLHNKYRLPVCREVINVLISC
jgi:hypothetical protein